MRADFLKSLLVLAFAAVAGTSGAVYASSPTQDDGVTTSGPQQQTPPDCKKNPEDPRCDK